MHARARQNTARSGHVHVNEYSMLPNRHCGTTPTQPLGMQADLRPAGAEPGRNGPNLARSVGVFRVGPRSTKLGPISADVGQSVPRNGKVGPMSTALPRPHLCKLLQLTGVAGPTGSSFAAVLSENIGCHSSINRLPCSRRSDLGIVLPDFRSLRAVPRILGDL